MASDPREAVKEAMMRKAREAMGKKTGEPQPHVPEPADFNGDYVEDTTGKIRFSEALKKAGYKNVVVPDGATDPFVKVYKKSDWPVPARKDIPEANLDYIWPWEQSVDLIEALENREKPLAVGNPGTGKSDWSQNFAAVTNHPYLRFNMNGGIEPDSFLGKIMLKDGETVWVDGNFPTALLGGYFINIDEVFKMVAPVAMACQWLFEDNGKLRLYDKEGDNLITPDAKAMIMLCDNTKGLGDNVDKYAATNVQDTSTLDRFGATVEFHYLPEDKEIQLIQAWYPQMTEIMARKIVKFANMVRVAYNKDEISLSFSPRTLKKVARKTLLHKNPARGISAIFFRKLADDGERSAVNAMFKTVFGTTYSSLS